jgi:hypothetical protein
MILVHRQRGIARCSASFHHLPFEAIDAVNSRIGGLYFLDGVGCVSQREVGFFPLGKVVVRHQRIAPLHDVSLAVPLVTHNDSEVWTGVLVFVEDAEQRAARNSHYDYQFLDGHFHFGHFRFCSGFAASPVAVPELGVMLLTAIRSIHIRKWRSAYVDVFVHKYHSC